MSSDFASSYGEDLGGLRLSSQRFDPSRFEWFSDYYAETESMIMEGDFDNLSTYGGGDELPPPPLMEEDAEDGKRSGSAPILPPMEEDAEDGKLSGNVQSLPPMEEDAEDGKLSGNAPMEGEGFSLREWRRQTVFRLGEKERREKEILKQIIEEADAYKAEYYKKWKLRCENSRTANREKEKLFLESREKFHAEADKNYWMAISELIPKEVVPIGKKEKKDKGKKPSIVVIQGPKPGKPTDLSRMRQVLVKLKHNPPDHMLPPPVEPEKNAKIQDSEPAASAQMSGKLPTTSDSCQAVVK